MIPFGPSFFGFSLFFSKLTLSTLVPISVLAILFPVMLTLCSWLHTTIVRVALACFIILYCKRTIKENPKEKIFTVSEIVCTNEIIFQGIWIEPV